MPNRNGSGRTLLLLISASFLVVATIAMLTFLSIKKAQRSGITLPSSSSEKKDEITAGLTGDGFLTVSPDNAAAVVSTLSRPETYHQTLYKQIISDDVTGVFSVHIWANGGICKLVLLESGQTRHILTDGTQVYLWYEDDPENIVKKHLPEGISLDDLSGIPTYETILDMKSEMIQEADYRQLSEQDNKPCLYVRNIDADGASMAFWVDLSTGLLCKAERVQEGKLRYSLHQTDLVVLDTSDAALNTQLLLPDRSNPFATAP